MPEYPGLACGPPRGNGSTIPYPYSYWDSHPAWLIGQAHSRHGGPYTKSSCRISFIVFEEPFLMSYHSVVDDQAS